MEQAGSVAIAALTALQIAKWSGAEVTAVCSTRNVELMRSLGADHVIDYSTDDFTRSDQRYDLLLDVAGSRGWSACRRVLQPKAKVVVVGAPKGSRLMGPLSHILKMRLAAIGSRRKATFFVAKTQCVTWVKATRRARSLSTCKPVDGYGCTRGCQDDRGTRAGDLHGAA